MSTTSGWGRFTWGQANWNADTTLKTGWGAQQWSGDGGWGDLSDQTVSVSLTGIQITSSIGSVDVPDVVLSLTGQEITSFQGEAFIPVMVEGISATFSIGSVSVVDMQVGLTGQQSTFATSNVEVNDMTIGLTVSHLLQVKEQQKHQTRQRFFLVWQSHQHKEQHKVFLHKKHN